MTDIFWTALELFLSHPSRFVKTLNSVTSEGKKNYEPSYLPHKQYMMPVCLYPGTFLMGKALELNYLLGKSGWQDKAGL